MPATKGKNVQVEISENTLTLLKKTVKEIGGESANIDADGLDSNLDTLLNGLLILFLSVVAERKGEQGSVVAKLEDKLQTAEDELDEVKQHSLKGNLIVTSPTANG